MSRARGVGPNLGVRLSLALAAALLLVCPSRARADAERIERVDRAREVFQDLITRPTAHCRNLCSRAPAASPSFPGS